MKEDLIKINGFEFAGIHCGIKDNVRKKDLTLIYSEEPNTLVDGVFTTNKVFAAPVAVCRDSLKNGKGRLVVINSGVANACTGERGLKDCLKTQEMAAKLFNLKPQEVFVCSTGKIGDLLPMKKIAAGLVKAQKKLSPLSFEEATRGIMTTDKYPKFAQVTGKLNGKPYTMAVLAKGAGMLCPNMATMLAYIVTDLAFEPKALKDIFRSSVELTLNRITVDGDTSTNDTVLILANGRAGNKPLKKGSAEAQKIQKQMTDMLEKMARAIAMDGEGATTCCDVFIQGAKNQADAKKIAYAIGNSPLVKTALFGNDPNWGRILAAVGYSGASIQQDEISVKMGATWLVKKGRGVKFSPEKVSQYMANPYITITVVVGKGKGAFHVYMSDLTYDYIHLNAEYHT